MEEQYKLEDFDFSRTKGDPGNAKKCVDIVSRHLDKVFTKSPDPRKQVLFTNEAERITLYCLYSKEKKNQNTSKNESFFTFRADQREGLKGYKKNYFALTLGDTSRILLFDTDDFLDNIAKHCRSLDNTKGKEKWDFNFSRDTKKIILKQTRKDVTEYLIEKKLLK